MSLTNGAFRNNLYLDCMSSSSRTFNSIHMRTRVKVVIDRITKYNPENAIVSYIISISSLPNFYINKKTIKELSIICSEYLVILFIAFAEKGAVPSIQVTYEM